MKTRVTGIVGLAVVLATAALARGQGNQPAPKQDNPMRAIELRHKQLDIEQRQAELNFTRQVQNLELEKKRLELEHSRQMFKGPDQKSGPVPGPGPDAWKGKHCKMKHFCGFVFMCMIVHVLLAIWVYQDIRKRNAGSGIWIVVTLLTGLLGALVYAVARLGDVKREG